jgi:hypothetical protein
MKRPPSLIPLFFTITVLAILLCTDIAGAALSDHPVVTGISGPSYLSKDDQGVYYGTYTFTATVTCGTPPYTFKWINPKISPKPIFEGTQYSTVQIPVSKLSTNPDEWGVWLTVTDAAGRDALWMRPGGSGNSNEFLYLLRVDELTRTTFTKLTEPATFPPAPSGCAQAGQSASGGGSSGSSSGGGGDLPLIPIAAGVGVVAVAGIAGAKLLSGRSASGGGNDPDTPPDTTRNWTDDTGRQRTATLQPDGTWISDSGSVVDLEKADSARRQHEQDLERSRANQEKDIARDGAKADADRNELEKIKADTDKAVKNVHDKQYEDAKNQRDADSREADMWKQTADRSDTIANGLGYVEKGADIAIDIGATLSPVVGGEIKTAYNATKTIGKGMAEAAVKGESVLGGALKGAAEAAVDKTLDMFGNALGDKFNGKIPGFGKFESAKDYGSTSLKTIKDTVGAKDLKNSVKNALQSQAQSATLWDPFKKFFTGD